MGGAVGRNLAGNLLKQYDLGTLGNSLAGVVAASAARFSALVPTLGSAAAGGGLDLGSIIRQVAGGGIGGGVVIVGMIKQMMAGAPAKQFAATMVFGRQGETARRCSFHQASTIPKAASDPHASW